MIRADRFGICPACWGEIREGEMIGTPEDSQEWCHEDCLDEPEHYDVTTRYKNYLRSPDWNVRRREALVRAGRRCQICSSHRSLEVHHNTYDRLFDEALEDLVVLCETCHEMFHELGQLGEAA